MQAPKIMMAGAAFQVAPLQRARCMHTAVGVRERRALPLVPPSHGCKTLLGKSWKAQRFTQPQTLCRAKSAEADGVMEELNEAVQKGDARMVTLLTGMGADVNAVETGGNTALHFASALGNAKIVQILVEAGADANQADSIGYKPLHMAAAEGHNKIVEVLVSAKADVNAPDAMDGFTALHMSAAEGRSEVLKVLVEAAGVDLEVTDTQGTTALHMAATNGFADCVQVLAQAGANIDSIDNFGRTPIMDAVAAGRVFCVKVLSDAGVNVNVTKDGINPLFALGEGHPEIMRILVAGGADLNATTWKDPSKQFGWSEGEDPSH